MNTETMKDVGRRVWVENNLRQAGLDYGTYPDGSYGHHRAKLQLDAFKSILDDLELSQLEERINLIRFAEAL